MCETPENLSKLNSKMWGVVKVGVRPFPMMNGSVLLLSVYCLSLSFLWIS